MAERLPSGVYDTETIKLGFQLNGLEQNGVHYPEVNGERYLRSDSINSSYLGSPMCLDSGSVNGTNSTTQLTRESDMGNGAKLPNDNGGVQVGNNGVLSPGKVPRSLQGSENSTKLGNLPLPGNQDQVEPEWIEQYEAGVYITLVGLRDGTRDLKRVRFRYLTKYLCSLTFG